MTPDPIRTAYPSALAPAADDPAIRHRLFRTYGPADPAAHGPYAEPTSAPIRATRLG